MSVYKDEKVRQCMDKIFKKLEGTVVREDVNKEYVENSINYIKRLEHQTVENLCDIIQYLSTRMHLFIDDLRKFNSKDAYKLNEDVYNWKLIYMNRREIHKTETAYKSINNLTNRLLELI